MVVKKVRLINFITTLCLQENSKNRYLKYLI
uniref:Uncharacterized protein n=1 Tax=Myoviridae sp. ctkfK18 TaxID=2825165 RepID=A0A8S5VGS2_9CAUD|nr:MAG TPA: hypothetical protein [Myoviridae sp. ctkfK18]